MSGASLRLLAALWAMALGACSVDDVSPEPIEAPFAVSDYFVPSGFMGDASRSPSPLELRYDCAPRPSGARGNCYRFVYHPPDDAESVGWAGVYWQSPANNWGQDRPQPVASNPRRVSFAAAGDVAGMDVTILVGGLRGNDPDGAPLPYGDTFGVTEIVTLGTDMAKYEVALPADASFSYVLGAFGFSMTADGAASRTLFLDDIVWLGE